MTLSLAHGTKRVWSRLATRWRVVAFFAGVVYFVILGGSAAGEQMAVLRAVNLAIAGILVAVWMRRAGEQDAVDKAVIVAVLLYLVTAVFSSNPRMSLDSAIQALAFAAVFWYARRLLATPTAFAALAWTFGALCIGVSAFFAVEWGAVWLEWARLTGFREMPPLSLPLPTALYLHRHDVALLTVILAPALLLPVGFGRPRWIRFAGIALIAIVVLIDGSRMLMLSLVGASVLCAAIAVLRRRSLPPGFRLGSRGSVVLLVIGVAGLATLPLTIHPLMARLLDLAPLASRAELWSAALGIWTGDPVTGSGPGTFLFALFDTEYFETSGYFPRNTDGALFMVLSETGLLGAVALAIPVVALARRAPAPGRPLPLLLFGPLTFVFAGVGSVPSDFGYLVLPAVLWVAAAYPAGSTSASARLTAPRRHRLVARLSAALLIIVTASIGPTVVAGFAYENGRRAAAAGQLDVAEVEFNRAMFWDGQFALYARTLGALQLSMNDANAAVATLARAASVEPRDPVTARLQAVAYVVHDDTSRAASAAARSLHLQPSQPLNLLVAALAAMASEDVAAARGHMDELLIRVPSILGTPRWPEELGQRPGPRDARRVLHDWAARQHVAIGIQAGMLAGIAGTDRHAHTVDAAMAATPLAGSALRAMFACDLDDARASLERGAFAEKAQPIYWLVHTMVARLRGEDASPEARLAAITGPSLGPPQSVGTWPLLDVWAYRRFAAPTLPLPIDLPSADFGFSEWLKDPRSAAAAAGAHTLADCRIAH